MKADKCENPIDILLFGSVAIMPIPNAFANPIEQAYRLKWRRGDHNMRPAGFAGMNGTDYKYSIGTKSCVIKQFRLPFRLGRPQ